MKCDIATVISFWIDAAEHLQVRRVHQGELGEKLQISVYNAILHLNTVGRPDGRCQIGCKTCSWHLTELMTTTDRDEWPRLFSEETVQQLKQELIYYVIRNLAFFKIKESHAAAQDAMHNLHLIDFCDQYCQESTISNAFLRHRPVMYLLYYRSLAMISLHDHGVEEAVRYLHTGCKQIQECQEQLTQKGVSSTRQAGQVLQKMAEHLQNAPLPESTDWVEHLTKKWLHKEVDRYNLLNDEPHF